MENSEQLSSERITKDDEVTETNRTGGNDKANEVFVDHSLLPGNPTPERYRDVYWCELREADNVYTAKIGDRTEIIKRNIASVKTAFVARTDPVAAPIAPVTNQIIFSGGIPFIRKDPRATIPTRATDGSAGFDLYAMDSAKIIGLEGMVAIDIGISVVIPRGHRGTIAMRSGLAKNQHLMVGAGVIDEDFRGTLMVLVTCIKNNHIYTIKPGERFAQLIIEPIYVDCSMPTRNTARAGTDTIENVTAHTGWGSTGKY